MAKKSAAKKRAASTALVKAPPPPAALAPTAAPAGSPLAIFETLARDTSVDVGKMRELLAFQKELMQMQARTAFEIAYKSMHDELPVIVKRGTIKTNKKEKGADGKWHKTGESVTQSRFARLGEDILPIVMPIAKKHGFTLRWQTSFPQEKAGYVRVRGILTHEGGHFETSDFEAKMDQSEYRSDTQSWGSTISYGQRYTTRDLLALTIQGIDDDGQRGHRSSRDDIPPVRRRPDVESGPPMSPEVLPAADATHPHTEERITTAMVSRLMTIIENSGREPRTVSDWLRRTRSYGSWTDIKRSEYDRIVAVIQGQGRLPE